MPEVAQSLKVDCRTLAQELGLQVHCSLHGALLPPDLEETQERTHSGHKHTHKLNQAGPEPLAKGPNTKSPAVCLLFHPCVCSGQSLKAVGGTRAPAGRARAGGAAAGRRGLRRAQDQFDRIQKLSRCQHLGRQRRESAALVSEASSEGTPLSPRVHAGPGGLGRSPAQARGRLPFEEDKPQGGRDGVTCSWLLFGGLWRWGGGSRGAPSSAEASGLGVSREEITAGLETPHPSAPRVGRILSLLCCVFPVCLRCSHRTLLF